MEKGSSSETWSNFYAKKLVHLSQSTIRNNNVKIFMKIVKVVTYCEMLSWHRLLVEKDLTGNSLPFSPACLIWFQPRLQMLLNKLNFQLRISRNAPIPGMIPSEPIVQSALHAFSCKTKYLRICILEYSFFQTVDAQFWKILKLTELQFFNKVALFLIIFSNEYFFENFYFSYSSVVNNKVQLRKETN